MILDSKFSPSWWLSNPHLQTLWASKVRRRVPVATFAQRLELDDGDFLDINCSNEQLAKALQNPLSGHLFANISARSPKGIVCIFHGLAGSINSSYASAIIHALIKHHYLPVFMHFRGCSSEPNRLAASYHSGHTVDIKYLVDRVKAIAPTTQVHAIGYSLGANALLKYLGEQAQHCPLSSAVTVSPPLVLQEGANRLMTGVSRIYQRYLLGIMQNQLEEKRKRYPHLELPENTGNWQSFWDFDNDVTAPLSGFLNVDDYYTRCSARQFLKHIAVPTQIISALDDPFFSKDIIPNADELSASVTLELSKTGGHVGFVSGAVPLKPGYWLDRRIIELLEQQSVSA